MGIARDLYNDLYKDKGLPGVVSASASSEKNLHRKSDKSKYTDQAFGVASSSVIPRATGKVSKHSIGTTGKYCSFHQINTHNTDRSKAVSRASAAIANQQASVTVPVGTTTLVPAPLTNNRTCHTCGAPGWTHQHRCNTAVRNEPPSDPAHRFGMMYIAGTASRSAISAGLGPSIAHFNTEVRSSPVAAVPSREYMDTDEHAAMMAQLCKSNEFLNLPKQRSNSILLPIVVENVRIYAYLDTRYTFSICSPRFFRSLGVGFTPSSGTVQLGHVNSQPPRLGYTTLNVFYNKI
jgi:hypothetical protein